MKITTLAVGVLALGSFVALVSCSDDDGGNGSGGATSTTGTATGSGTGGTGGTGGASSGGSGVGGSGDEHQLCVDLVNTRRATVPLSDYQRWTAAEECSDQQAEDDAIAGTPNSTLGACGETTSTVCWVAAPAEDFVPGCIEMMWSMGPGDANYDLLASDTYTQLACGLHTESNGDRWLMLNFQ